MKVSTALNRAQKKLGWKDAQVAAAVGVSQSAVWRWKAGQQSPRFPQYQALRAHVPGFAEIMDKAEAA